MIDCKKYASDILDSIKGNGWLAVISIGDDPASQSYIRGKKRDCERVGFKCSHYQYPENVSQDEIIDLISRLNDDPLVTGIIVQLPLPPHLDADLITHCVSPVKDVDGFTPGSPYLPCTPEGVLYIMQQEMGDLTGKHALIIGRGKLVGAPLQPILLRENMTVTMCHSRSRKEDISLLASNADAIIVAVGIPKLFSFACKESAVVIDCGVNRGEDGKLCGDVLSATTEHITPVPGGVGLLTRAMLMRHIERSGL